MLQRASLLASRPSWAEMMCPHLKTFMLNGRNPASRNVIRTFKCVMDSNRFYVFRVCIMLSVSNWSGFMYYPCGIYISAGQRWLGNKNEERSC